VPQRFHVTLEREKEEYDLHENSPVDEGYIRFLSRFSQPFLERLSGQQQGLDFGCGPSPVLATLLEESGHSVALYDPVYQNNKSVLGAQYDFIAATEVVEHFRNPVKEFDRLFDLLLPGGLLGIMTKMTRDVAAFRTWHYIRDPTHICFYKRETFTYLGNTFGASVTFVGDDVILLQKY
jgi:2-polyprenyl-3-methyl-5-hydroxy-6-metoxy-1,4-benzoquinol methylase